MVLTPLGDRYDSLIPRCEPVLCILPGSDSTSYRREMLTLEYAPNLEIRTAQQALADWTRAHQEAGTRNEDADWTSAPKVDYEALRRPESYEPFLWRRYSESVLWDRGEVFEVGEVLYWMRLTEPRGLRALLRERAESESELDEVRDEPPSEEG